MWRSPKEAYHPDCCMPRVKHGGGSVMLWAAMSWHYRPNTGARWLKDYRTILEGHVHPVVQTLYTEGGTMFRMIMHQYTQQDWGQWFDEHESEDEHLSRPAQSPDLNIMSHFGVFWRSKSGNVFFHQHHVVTWPLFCKRNDSKSLWLLCRTCICHSQD